MDGERRRRNNVYREAGREKGNKREVERKEGRWA
jgi:hypothetical protein